MTQVTTNKPSSLDEKRQVEDVKEFIQRKWLFVHELKFMLDEFPDDAWVEVNQVGNINVYEDDKESFSTIDMLWVKINRWGEEEE